MDSSGVASLVEGLKASRDVGSRFILFGLNRTIREVLQLSKLVKIFEITRTKSNPWRPEPAKPTKRGSPTRSMWN